MRLVKNHVVPGFALEDMRVATGERIGSNTDIEMVLVIPTLSQLFTALGRAMIAEDFEAWKELLKFHLPIEQDTGGDYLQPMSAELYELKITLAMR